MQPIHHGAAPAGARAGSAAVVERDQLDAGFLMWDIRRRELFGAVRTRYPASPNMQGKLLVVGGRERRGANLCRDDPGYEVTLISSRQLRALDGKSTSNLPARAGCGKSRGSRPGCGARCAHHGGAGSARVFSRRRGAKSFFLLGLPGPASPRLDCRSPARKRREISFQVHVQLKVVNRHAQVRRMLNSTTFDMLSSIFREHHTQAVAVCDDEHVRTGLHSAPPAGSPNAATHSQCGLE